MKRLFSRQGGFASPGVRRGRGTQSMPFRKHGEKRMEERKSRRGAALCCAALTLSFIIGAAHLWRAGEEGWAAACIVWMAACFSRGAWMRPVSLAVSALFCVEWLFTMGELVRLRLALGAPWMRLAVILLGVAALSAAAAGLAHAAHGRAWFCRGRERAFMQGAACILAFVPLCAMARYVPHLLLVERFLPGFGVVQALAAGLWSAFICGLLMEKKKAYRVRMRVWRLFSVVFFAQLALASAGWAVFAMSGELHIPVPGVIVAGVLYRGGLSFMPVLFLVSVLLAGSAWCSHLCYFGSWDAWAASFARPSRHPGPLRWRVLSLAVVCGAALLLSRGAGTGAAVACGTALGLVMIPVSVFVSRKKGWAAYCTTLCPLGLLSCLLGRLSPWRLRRTSACTSCGACARLCRYGALTEKGPAEGGPGLSCTLCRACLAACPRGGLGMTFCGRGAEGGAERAFTALVSAMHAVFLFTAMV